MAKIIDVLVCKGSPVGLNYLQDKQAEAKAKAQKELAKEIREAKYQRDVLIQALLKARKAHKKVSEIREDVFTCVRFVRDLNGGKVR